MSLQHSPRAIDHDSVVRIGGHLVTLLRGIAWAGKRPVEELVNYVAPPRPGRGGTAKKGE